MAGVYQGVVLRDLENIAEGFAGQNEGVGMRSNPRQVGFTFGTLINPDASPPNGDTTIPLDIPYTTASGTGVTIYRANKALLHARLRVLSLGMGFMGNVAWAGGTALAVQDTSPSQNVLAYIPISALGSLNNLHLPASQSVLGLQVTASSYNATTGAVTFPASTFISGSLANFPFRVVAGTGAQNISGIISSVTTTVMTPVKIPNGTIDATSVFEFPYWQASAGAAGSITASNGTFGVNAVGAGPYSVQIVGGTGVGQSRGVLSNTATALTVADNWTTTPDNTSVFLVTSNSSLFGVWDAGITPRWPIIGKGPQGTPQVGVGLQVIPYGTFSAGSNFRIWGSGVFE